MTKSISIHGVPVGMHRALKLRAAEERLSMSDYLKRLIERDLKRSSWAEMTKRMDALEPIRLSEPAAELIRRERDGR